VENILKLRKTPRSQALAPQGPKNGEEEHIHRLRHTGKAHVEKDWTGSRLTYAEKERVERKRERRNGGEGDQGEGRENGREGMVEGAA